MDAFTEMLRSWQNFYFMMGGVAATLLGIMFVAISLGIHLVNEQNRESIQTFVTPSIFYFVAALVLAGMMLIPDNQPLYLAITLLLMGIIAAIRVSLIVVLLVRAALKYGDFDLPEWTFQIVSPILSVILTFVAAGFFFFNQWTFGFLALWFVIILLLLSAISNTWSLVLWIVQQRQE